MGRCWSNVCQSPADMEGTTTQDGQFSTEPSMSLNSLNIFITLAFFMIVYLIGDIMREGSLHR